MSIPESFERRPLVCPQLEEKPAVESESDLKLQPCGGPSEETSAQENIKHVNHTQILMISREREPIINRHSEGILPLFHSSEQLTSLLRNNLHLPVSVSSTPRYDSKLNTPKDSALPALKPNSILKDSTLPNLKSNTQSKDSALPVLKSVLKTGHRRKKGRAKFMSSKPMKTVKFLESVTVVTVY